MPPDSLYKLHNRQGSFSHQHGFLAESSLKRFCNLRNAVSVVGDKSQDGDILLLTFPESHAFGDGETVKAGADFLTNEGLHHRLGHLTSVGDVTTEEQLELHLGDSLSTDLVWGITGGIATPLVPLSRLAHLPPVQGSILDTQ